MHAAEAREKICFTKCQSTDRMATVLHFLFSSFKTTHKSGKGKRQEVSATSLTQDLPAPFCLEFSNSNTYHLKDCLKKKYTKNRNNFTVFVCTLKSLRQSQVSCFQTSFRTQFQCMLHKKQRLFTIVIVVLCNIKTLRYKDAK